MSRTVILHYHLFKNAGTSLDQILKKNFGKRWVTREFPTGGDDNSAAVADWIRAEPEAVVFSTHTALGPTPQIDGIDIVSVMLLRDPIARIRSAYRFERKQKADTWGAELAKTNDLQGYVQIRLARPNDRQCRNFQAHRLASLVPGPAPEIERARQALDQLSVVGLVEDFDGAVQALAERIRPHYPDFTWTSVQANTTSKAPDTDVERRADEILQSVNQDDHTLWQEAAQRIGLALPVGDGS